LAAAATATARGPYGKDPSAPAVAAASRCPCPGLLQHRAKTGRRYSYLLDIVANVPYLDKTTSKFLFHISLYVRAHYQIAKKIVDRFTH